MKLEVSVPGVRRLVTCLLCLALLACSPGSDQDAGLHEVHYHLMHLEKEARQAAEGDEEAMEALESRRDRIDARMAALVEPEGSGLAKWRQPDAAGRAAIALTAKRWSEQRQEIERLLASRNALIKLALASNEVSFASLTIRSLLDEIARTLLKSEGDVRSLFLVHRLEFLAHLIPDWPGTLVDIDTIGRVDGGFWNCGRDVAMLVRSLTGLRHGDAEFRVDAVQSTDVQILLDKALEAAASVSAAVERICGLENELNAAHEALEALRYREEDWPSPDRPYTVVADPP